MLEVYNLTKKYRKHLALSNLSFHVNAGEIVGLVGPNGAGKTTSLRSIAGIIRPTEGRVRVGGYEFSTQERDAKRLIAFVPEQPNPYEMLTVWEHLKFIALAYDTMDGFDARAAELLERFDISDKRNALVATLSKGMRQKLVIACAFLHRARVFLFDEPLIGLDPRGARELKDQIVKARDEGAAILVSTHMLDTAQTLCDRIIILRKGEVVAEGNLAMLQERAHAAGDATLEQVFLTLTSEEAQTNAIQFAQPQDEAK